MWRESNRGNQSRVPELLGFTAQFHCPVSRNQLGSRVATLAAANYQCLYADQNTLSLSCPFYFGVLEITIPRLSIPSSYFLLFIVASGRQMRDWQSKYTLGIVPDPPKIYLTKLTHIHIIAL